MQILSRDAGQGRQPRDQGETTNPLTAILFFTLSTTFSK